MHEPCPNSIYIVDVMKIQEGAQYTLNMHLGSTDVCFSIKCEPNWQHQDVLNTLAMILSCSPTSIVLQDKSGTPWVYMPNFLGADVWVTSVSLHRGGMYNSVSPTVPFEQGEQGEPETEPPSQQVRQDVPHQPEPLPLLPEDPPAHEVDAQDQESSHADPAHERDAFLGWLREIGAEVEFTRSPIRRSRSPQRDTTTNMMRASRSRSRSPGLARTVYHSRVWPTSPPAAQPDPIPKSVYVDNKNIGTIFAAPTADVTEVIDEFVMNIRPLSFVQINPLQAIEWRHVTYLEIDPPPTPRCDDMPLDLREGRWERLQKIRMVPMIKDGDVLDIALFPWHLPINEAQYRLDEVSVEEEDYWGISATNCDTWVIAPIYLPPILRERDFRIWRTSKVEEACLCRMPSQILTTAMTWTVSLMIRMHVRSFWQLQHKVRDDMSDDSVMDNLRVTYFYAHDTSLSSEYWLGTDASVIADMICYFADVHSHSTDDIVVTCATCLPALSDRIVNYLHEEIYVILLRHVYHVDFIGKWIFLPDDMQNMARKQRGPRMCSTLVFDHPLRSPSGPPTTLLPLRGGARQQRGFGLEAMQKQQMATWALTRSHDACPSVDSKLLKALLRESRMVSAVLHSRSDVQVIHVVIAAMKRVGLTSMALALEASSPMSQGHGEAQNQTENENEEEDNQQHEIPHGDLPRANLPAPPPLLREMWTLTHINAESHQQHQRLQHMIQDIHLRIQQMTILHQHQYEAAMRFDLVPLIHQMQQIHGEISQALHYFNLEMQKFDQRMGMWETTFLPAVFERMQEIQPLHQPSQQQQVMVQQSMPQQTQSTQTPATPTSVTPTQTYPDPDVVTPPRSPTADPTVLELVQARSVIHRSRQNRPHSRAMTPFQGNH